MTGRRPYHSGMTAQPLHPSRPFRPVFAGPLPGVFLFLFFCLSFAPATASAQPLAGRIWDTRAARFIPASELIERTTRAHWLLLGEIHDNPEHHSLRTSWLDALVRSGRKPALAMEQFDRDHQDAIDKVAATATRADDFRNAGRFDTKGWHWPSYAPLVQIALDHRLPLLAANLSRNDAFRVATEGTDAVLGNAPAADLLRGRPLPDSARARLEAVLDAGHCGKAPAHILPGMVAAQRARDAVMAQVLRDAGGRGAVLIAGNGHVRRDFGVPHYLGGSAFAGDMLVVGILEIRDGHVEPAQYYHAGEPEYDLIVFTTRREREDPCASLRFRPRQPTAQP